MSDLYLLKNVLTLFIESPHGNPASPCIPKEVGTFSYQVLWDAEDLLHYLTAFMEIEPEGHEEVTQL